MQGKTILLLLLLVGGLGALVWMQQEEAAADPDGFIDYVVFDGIDYDRIHAIQIEHIERFWNVRLECDSRGDWYLTEPIAYRAASGMVNSLLDQIRQLRGIEVVEIEQAAGLGLDPPRAVITVSELPVDPASAASAPPARSVTVEVGAVDLDGNTLYVRTGGRILRIPRTLHNAINGSDEDFRSRRLTEVSPFERAIEITRKGRYFVGGDDLSFEALAERSRWFATQPARVSLDPATMHLFEQQVFGANITKFFDDNPGELSRYGLAEPLLELELRTARGNTVQLSFGHPAEGEEIWLAMRNDSPFIWRVSPRDVEFFATPFDQFYDYALVRANRSDIESITLVSDAGALRLIQTPAEWVLTEELDVAVTDLHRDQITSADAGKVGDLLAALEQTELVEFLELDAEFVPGSGRRSFEILTKSGTVFGGEIGAEYSIPGGGRGFLFLRRDDAIVAVLPAELAEQLRVAPSELRSLIVHKLVEREQRTIRLRRDGVELAYQLDQKANLWLTEGTTLEAKSFALLVDRLISMRVSRWLPVSEYPPSTDGAITLEIRSIDGKAHVVRLLRTPDGHELCEKEGRWGELRPGLVPDLTKLY